MTTAKTAAQVLSESIAALDLKIAQATAARAPAAYISQLRREAGRLSLARAKSTGAAVAAVARMAREAR